MRATAAEITPQALLPGQILRGHFVQDRQLAGFPKQLRSEGSFVLVPGRGLIWRSEAPFKNITVISRRGIVQTVGGKETMRLSAARIPGLGQLYDIMEAAVSGDTTTLEQAFTIQRTIDAHQWQLLLTPKSADVSVSQLKSLSVKGGRLVDTIDVDKGGGDVDHLTFLNSAIEPLTLSEEERSLVGSQK
jgi:hypothetical protein